MACGKLLYTSYWHLRQNIHQRNEMVSAANGCRQDAMQTGFTVQGREQLVLADHSPYCVRSPTCTPHSAPEPVQTISHVPRACLHNLCL